MGKLLALVLVLLALAAIGFLLYRPGAVIGVSEKSLAESIRAAADAEDTGTCAEREGDDERFICKVVGSSPDETSLYEVETKDAGCWDATRMSPGPQPETLSGCITIVDLVRAT